MSRPLIAALAVALLAPAAARAQDGLAPTEVAAWLQGVGAEVAPPVQGDDGVTLPVRDGALSWGVRFPGCEASPCGDLQFHAAFASPGATADALAAWNRDQRFLKAHLDAQGRAVVEFDLILNTGEAADQLAAPASVWVDGVRRFARHVGYAAPAE